MLQTGFAPFPASKVGQRKPSRRPSEPSLRCPSNPPLALNVAYVDGDGNPIAPPGLTGYGSETLEKSDHLPASSGSAGVTRKGFEIGGPAYGRNKGQGAQQGTRRRSGSVHPTPFCSRVNSAGRRPSRPSLELLTSILSSKNAKKRMPQGEGEEPVEFPQKGNLQSPPTPSSSKQTLSSLCLQGSVKRLQGSCTPSGLRRKSMQGGAMSCKNLAGFCQTEEKTLEEKEEGEGGEAVSRSCLREQEGAENGRRGMEEEVGVSYICLSPSPGEPSRAKLRILTHQQESFRQKLQQPVLDVPRSPDPSHEQEEKNIPLRPWTSHSLTHAHTHRQAARLPLNGPGRKRGEGRRGQRAPLSSEVEAVELGGHQKPKGGLQWSRDGHRLKIGGNVQEERSHSSRTERRRMSSIAQTVDLAVTPTDPWEGGRQPDSSDIPTGLPPAPLICCGSSLSVSASSQTPGGWPDRSESSGCKTGQRIHEAIPRPSLQSPHWIHQQHPHTPGLLPDTGADFRLPAATQQNHTGPSATRRFSCPVAELHPPPPFSPYVPAALDQQSRQSLSIIPDQDQNLESSPLCTEGNQESSPSSSSFFPAPYFVSEGGICRGRPHPSAVSLPSPTHRGHATLDGWPCTEQRANADLAAAAGFSSHHNFPKEFTVQKLRPLRPSSPSLGLSSPSILPDTDLSNRGRNSITPLTATLPSGQLPHNSAISENTQTEWMPPAPGPLGGCSGEGGGPPWWGGPGEGEEKNNDWRGISRITTPSAALTSTRRFSHLQSPLATSGIHRPRTCGGQTFGPAHGGRRQVTGLYRSFSDAIRATVAAKQGAQTPFWDRRQSLQAAASAASLAEFDFAAFALEERPLSR
uniref:Uncharacterized protein n=1 Tax=Chromera velia CCMP2878 TaxID=1169474 RepID=A0A0G4HQ83_9ALVE|eukprot:Cvel_7910.t1-p1 / transcript=Cvel_7910.t1 / gene=Cvel_7910 / organism=Chromera_velia_CCMP2878 / gene_product=hypothetical protein / transcript_product=hypothetical protein / location=Cvel_scaffold424:43235-45802(+) / protein_length=856 / sequence_SO=supercontig / SO=protein_coding / is_pseudo=false